MISLCAEMNMNSLIKVSIILAALISVSNAGSAIAILPSSPETAINYHERLSSNVPESTYQARSSEGISSSFLTRFGKHCTTHKDFFGRINPGLCDSPTLCSNEKQYQACYNNCVVKRNKGDNKEWAILNNLARCSSNNFSNESHSIKNQAIRRLNDKAKKQIKAKTAEMPVDSYEANASKSFLPSWDHIARLGTHCTSHNGRKGICDFENETKGNTPCNRAQYKECYTKCIKSRRADEKTPFILKNLSGCRVNLQDLELGAIAQDVYQKYHQYERENVRLSPSFSDIK